MSFNDNFSELKSIFMSKNIEEVDGFLAFQFDIIGDGSGTFYAELKNGKLSIEPYEYIDRQAVFTASFDVFKNIALGNLDPVKAFITKKLSVDGDFNKALKLKRLI